MKKAEFAELRPCSLEKLLTMSRKRLTREISDTSIQVAFNKSKGLAELSPGVT